MFYGLIIRMYYAPSEHPSIKRVSPLANYIILVEFDNDETGYLDMKPYLNFGVFKKIRDPEVFKQVRISFDTVEWSSGIDLDPEFVYTNCQKKTSPTTA